MHMTQLEKLAPCPCGRAATFLPDDSYGSCQAGCNCEAEPYIIRPIGHDAECIAAWNAFAARPTAGIDREVARMREIANDWRRPALRQVEGPNDLKIYGGTIADDIDRWANMLEAPAKTGEQGAVIEECARIADAEAAIMLGNEQDKKHSRALRASCRMSRATAEGIARAIRALSQPLPDAPIVGGEGES